MAHDSRQAYAHSARGDPAAGWEEPSLGGAERRESVGERLRRERETYGLHLREVSESLRIRYAYLDAIERSAFDELPGPTYAVGFVRGYAQFLGLDDDRIVQRFKDESQGLKRDQELHFPEPVNEGKIPGKTILALSLALIAAAYGAWAYLSDGDRSIAELVPPVPESLQRMVGATEAPPPPEATDLSNPAGGAADPGAAQTAGDAEPTGESAAAPSGDLPGEQVAELPETAPDPELAGDGAGEAAAPDGGGSQASGGDGTETAAAPDAPARGAGTEGATSDSREAGATAGGAGGIPDAPDTGQEEAAGPGGAANATAGRATAADDAGNGGSAGGGANPTRSAEGADGTADNPQPPAVPEMQQDDGGIPTAPDQTRTAGAETQGDGTDGRSFGASPTTSRVTLVATARSWVQVRGPDDSLILTRLLRPGDRYHVPDREGLTLHTGNAGGLRVMVDGREVGQLGGAGEVRRDVRLEPRALAAGG